MAMKRRELIQSLGLVSTHALLPGVLSGFLMRCSSKEAAQYKYLFFSDQEYLFIKELIDIMLPTTTTKSASEVGVQDFLDEVFAKCLQKEQQELIHEGLQSLMKEAHSVNDTLGLIKEVDSRAYQNEETYAYFRFIKQYTLVGFFTSQEGETKASNYVKFPGDYEGEIELDQNTLNYGETGLRYYL